jgi:endonuclease/exonuclease/phosphatase family metal-dependent hydrolase
MANAWGAAAAGVAASLLSHARLPLPPMRDALRLATLNLWGRFADWPRRRDILAAQLPSLDIDVYLLQEVVCSAEGGDQLAELAEILGFAWSTRAVAESRPHEAEEEGVAILSRLPLYEMAAWPLPPSRPPRQRLEAVVAGPSR